MKSLVQFFQQFYKLCVYRYGNLNHAEISRLNGPHKNNYYL